jgi:hypothetical protein
VGLTEQKNQSILSTITCQPLPSLKIDLARLPPCQSALTPHVQRVNHRLCLYKRANVPIWERPKLYYQVQEWIRTDEGVLEPLWSCGPVLPMSLVDLLDTTDHEEEEDDDEEDGRRGRI